MLLFLVTLAALWQVEAQTTCGSCWWGGCTSATISRGSPLIIDGAQQCSSGYYAYVSGVTIASQDYDFTSYKTYVDSSLTRQYDRCSSNSSSCSFSNSSTCGYGTGYEHDAVVVIKCENSDASNPCDIVYDIDWNCAEKSATADGGCGSCTRSNCQATAIAPGGNLTFDGYYACPGGYYAAVEGVTIASSDYGVTSYRTYASSSLDYYYSNCSSDFASCSASDFATCGLGAPSTSDAVVVIKCENTGQNCNISYGIDWVCDRIPTVYYSGCGWCTSSSCQSVTIDQRDTLFVNGTGQCPDGFYAYVNDITIASSDYDRTSYRTYVNSSQAEYYTDCSSTYNGCSAYSSSTCGYGNAYQSDAVVAITCQNHLYYQPSDTCQVEYDIDWSCASKESTPTINSTTLSSTSNTSSGMVCGLCSWDNCTSATIFRGSPLIIDGAQQCSSGYYAYVDGITIASQDYDYTSYKTYVDSSLTHQYDHCSSNFSSCSFFSSSTCGYGTGYERDAVVVIKCENSDAFNPCDIVYDINWNCAEKTTTSNSGPGCGSCTSSNCQTTTIAPGGNLTIDGSYHCPWGNYATVEGVTIASSDDDIISYRTYASSSLDYYYSNCSDSYVTCSASDFATCGLGAPSTSDAVVVIKCENGGSGDCNIGYGIDWFCDPTPTVYYSGCGWCTSSSCQGVTIDQRDTLFVNGTGLCPDGYYAYVDGITIASSDYDKTSYKTYVNSSHAGYYSDCSSDGDSCSAYSSSTCGYGNAYRSDAVVAITCQNHLYYQPNDTCQVDYDIDWSCASKASTPTSTPRTTTRTPSTTSSTRTTTAPSTAIGAFEGSYTRTAVYPNSCIASMECAYECAASYEVVVTGRVAKAYSSANPNGCSCEILTADISGNKATGSTTDSTFVMTLTTTGLVLEMTVDEVTCTSMYNAVVAATTGSASAATKGATFEWAAEVVVVALTSWAISRAG